MASDDTSEEIDEEIDDEIDDDEDIDPDFVDDEDDEDEVDVVEDDDIVDDDEVVDDEDDEDDEEEEEGDAALEELEAAELEIEDDPETLLVDEAAEIREMRRDELGIGGSAREQSADEFVCTECFLVKKVSQLSNKTRKICRDCV